MYVCMYVVVFLCVCVCVCEREREREIFRGRVEDPMLYLVVLVPGPGCDSSRAEQSGAEQSKVRSKGAGKCVVLKLKKGARKPPVLMYLSIYLSISARSSSSSSSQASQPTKPASQQASKPTSFLSFVFIR